MKKTGKFASWKLNGKPLKREKIRKKLDAINRQIANAREELDSINAAWKSEKEIVDTIQNIKKEIEELEIIADKAERESPILKKLQKSVMAKSKKKKPCSK